MLAEGILSTAKSPCRGYTVLSLSSRTDSFPLHSCCTIDHFLFLNQKECVVGWKLVSENSRHFTVLPLVFPQNDNTSTKTPHWSCSLTRVCLLTDSFCENWNLWKVLEKIGKLLWKLMLSVIITTHMIIVCGQSGRHKKGRGGVKSAKALPFFIPIPLPISLHSYPLPLLTDTCYTGLYCTRASEVNWQFDSKENFTVRPGWILIEELS